MSGSYKLLNIDSNAKTVKGQKKGYATGILYLAPADVSGYEVCPGSSSGCREACLNTAGRGKMSRVQEARVRKTKFFFENRALFLTELEADISRFIKWAKKKDFIPVVRLNGTSDIVWERISFVGEDGKTYNNMMERFPEIQFYDYTKLAGRKNLPKNYHLTFSLHEENENRASKAIQNGMNVAVVFRDELPKKYMKLNVINGDETDLRFLDKKKKIVGLKAKGKAKKDTKGFVK